MSSYSQLFGRFPYRVKVGKKIIALTFVDGPNEPYTSQIVDYLNEKNIKATFFEVGECVRKYPEITKKIYQSGHVIGNHSLSHVFKNYFSSLAFNREIDDSQQIIEKCIGVKPALFRSPWLFRQPWLLMSLKQRELQPVSGLFCHALEVFQPSAKRIARRTIAKAKPGTIIIFHDGVESKGGDRSETVGAVKLTVDELIKKGFSFVTVDELLDVPAYL